MRRAGISAVLAVVVASAVSACGGSSAAPTATTAPATTAQAPTQSTALQVACQGYNSAHLTARQVANSAAKPIVAGAPALFLISLRQTATDAIASVPEAAAVFTELRDAIDDLNNQATSAVPPGADVTKTLVTVKPARLSAALDAADKLCAPR